MGLGRCRWYTSSSSITFLIIEASIEPTYRKQVVVENRTSLLGMVCVPDKETSQLRTRTIRDGDGFLLLYSITSRLSFDRLEESYQHLAYEKGRIPPIILVATKADMHSERVVSREEGARLAARLRCSFLETSALTGQDVDRVFNELVRAMRAPPAP
ncbi:P-loop containing nucleoside triphosphate hydrolase protein [Mycena filopes]|nr:P-loop containing nucleoside triphosphate hydrolase protein [Mycena filopes]